MQHHTVLYSTMQIKAFKKKKKHEKWTFAPCTDTVSFVLGWLVFWALNPFYFFMICELLRGSCIHYYVSRRIIVKYLSRHSFSISFQWLSQKINYSLKIRGVERAVLWNSYKINARYANPLKINCVGSVIECDVVSKWLLIFKSPYMIPFASRTQRSKSCNQWREKKPRIFRIPSILYGPAAPPSNIMPVG